MLKHYGEQPKPISSTLPFNQSQFLLHIQNLISLPYLRCLCTLKIFNHLSSILFLNINLFIYLSAYHFHTQAYCFHTSIFHTTCQCIKISIFILYISVNSLLYYVCTLASRDVMTKNFLWREFIIKEKLAVFPTATMEQYKKTGYSPHGMSIQIRHNSC